MSRLSGKKAGIKIFLIAALITFVLCVMVTIAGVTAYYALVYDKGNTSVHQAEDEGIEPQETPEAEMESIQPSVAKKDDSKTVAIFGTDKAGSLTDVILVAHFKSETNEVNILSIPRDTKVEWTKEQTSILPKAHQWVRVSKINEMTSWGSIDDIRPLTIATLEKLLGVKIDHYVVVNLDAFRQIVDAIGGVEVEVKQRMKKDDYSQGLHIDLYPGVQVLDGEKAEQFVRFRSYPTGDLGRIEAQQQFLEAFAKKVLSPDIITKMPKIVPILFTSIKTDVGLTEIPTYYPYLKEFSMDKLHFSVLPGEAHEENNLSYFFPDLDAVCTLVQELFF